MIEGVLTNKPIDIYRVSSYHVKTSQLTLYAFNRTVILSHIDLDPFTDSVIEFDEFNCLYHFISVGSDLKEMKLVLKA